MLGSTAASATARKKLKAFATDFQKRWKDATTCRAGYVVSPCSNAPGPKSASTAD